MDKITEMEMNVMNWVAFNEMTPANGAEPESYEEAHCWLWIDEIAAEFGITKRQAVGVVGSLCAKGYMGTDGQGNGSTVVTEFGTREDIGIWFTEEGFSVWKEART